MMKFCSLSSGSKQNCHYIETDEAQFLIDAGISFKLLKSFMHQIGRDLDKLTGLIITHEHGDHTRGLKSILKNLDIPVYISENSRKHLFFEDKSFVLENSVPIIENEMIRIGDAKILPFHVNHDAAETFGFRITNHVKTLFFATDIGSFSRRTVELSKGAHMIAIESNYDPEMLTHSFYPLYLKKRIAGKMGHLSNRGSAEFLNLAVGDETSNIIFLHLSENNNSPEIVKRMIREELTQKYPHIRFHVSNREKPGALIDV